MFTIKLYTAGGKQRIFSADSFTVLRTQMMTAYEVTAHDIAGNGGTRFDVGATGYEPDGGNWDWAFIVNEAGKTVESLRPLPEPAGSGQTP